MVLRVSPMDTKEGLLFVLFQVNQTNIYVCTAQKITSQVNVELKVIDLNTNAPTVLQARLKISVTTQIIPVQVKIVQYI